jgi:hypothetical protein
VFNLSGVAAQVRCDTNADKLLEFGVKRSGAPRNSTCTALSIPNGL